MHNKDYEIITKNEIIRIIFSIIFSLILSTIQILSS